jgi:hypothetical protein
MSKAKPLDRPEAPTGLHKLVTTGDHRSYTDAYVADLAACGFVPRSELEAAEVRVKAWDRAAIATAIKAMSSPERTLLLIDVVEDSSALAGRCVWCRYEGSSAYGCTRGESEADRLRTQLSTAEQRIRELEREVELYSKGYAARGQILAAYRTGRQPSGKALDDVADVQEKLGLISKADTNASEGK